MSHRFTDIKVRDQYIIGLTEVITEIFGITEKSQKKSVYNELYGLDDEALINKQNFVEQYFDETTLIYKKYLSKVKVIKNSIQEVAEKTNFNPSFSI